MEVKKIGAKVLIVDDDLLLIRMFVKALKKFGFEVRAAVNGEEALDCIKHDYFDLIISDVEMPVIDGYKLITIVKSKYRHLKILIISADFDYKYFLRKGAIQTLQKPFNVIALKDEIDKVLEDRRRTRRFLCNSLNVIIKNDNVKFKSEGEVLNIGLDGCLAKVQEGLPTIGSQVGIAFEGINEAELGVETRGIISRKKRTGDSGVHEIAFIFDTGRDPDLLENLKGFLVE